MRKTWWRIWKHHQAITTMDIIMEDMEMAMGIMVMDTMGMDIMVTMIMATDSIIMAMDITMVIMDMEDIIIMAMDMDTSNNDVINSINKGIIEYLMKKFHVCNFNFLQKILYVQNVKLGSWSCSNL